MTPLTEGQLRSLNAYAKRGMAESLDVRRLIVDLREARAIIGGVQELVDEYNAQSPGSQRWRIEALMKILEGNGET